MNIITTGLLGTAVLVSYVSCLAGSVALSAEIFLERMNNVALYFLGSFFFLGISATVVTYLWSLTGVM